MFLIEPCCTKRQFLSIRAITDKGGTTMFEGYDDLSLAELLPAILLRYDGVEVLLVTPSLPDHAAEAIIRWMNQQWARADGKGKLDVIGRLTIITDFGKKKSPIASGWLKENPFGERLMLVDKKQTETAILLPDIAIIGPVNLRYGRHFIATATGGKENIEKLWKQYSAQTSS